MLDLISSLKALFTPTPIRIAHGVGVGWGEQKYSLSLYICSQLLVYYYMPNTKHGIWHIVGT